MSILDQVSPSRRPCWIVFEISSNFSKLFSFSSCTSGHTFSATSSSVRVRSATFLARFSSSSWQSLSGIARKAEVCKACRVVRRYLAWRLKWRHVARRSSMALVTAPSSANCFLGSLQKASCNMSGSWASRKTLLRQ